MAELVVVAIDRSSHRRGRASRLQGWRLTARLDLQAAPRASKQQRRTLPGVSRELANRLRAYAYRAYTKLPEHQRGRAPGTFAVQRFVNGGPVCIEGGVGKGLAFAPDAVPLGHVQAHRVVRGSHEVGGQEALRRSVAPGAVVYDVGANVGFFSLIAARLTGVAGQVHAFEPIPENVAGIRANATANDFAIQIHEVAVSDYDLAGVAVRRRSRSWVAGRKRSRRGPTAAPRRPRAR